MALDGKKTTVTAVDPVMAEMLRQQMLLTQGVMDLPFRTVLDFHNNQCNSHSSAELYRPV